MHTQEVKTDEDLCARRGTEQAAVIILRKMYENKQGHKYHNLRCLYMDGRSMGNEHEELEILVQEGNYDLIADWV